MEPSRSSCNLTHADVAPIEFLALHDVLAAIHTERADLAAWRVTRGVLTHERAVKPAWSRDLDAIQRALAVLEHESWIAPPMIASYRPHVRALRSQVVRARTVLSPHAASREREAFVRAATRMLTSLRSGQAASLLSRSSRDLLPPTSRRCA